MSEKQRFNKGANLRQIAEKRRERWLSRKILSEIIDAVRKQRDDSNWIIYQVLKNDSKNLNYKSKIKMFNWLANSGYDVENLRPIKKDDLIIPGDRLFIDIKKIKDSYRIQEMTEKNHKLHQKLNETNELLNELYTHLTTKALRTAWESKKDCKKFDEILDKIEKWIKEV